MNFKAFQQSKQKVENIQQHLLSQGIETEFPYGGYIYADTLYIGITSECKDISLTDLTKEGKYYLAFSNQEYISNDLEYLESLLYKYCYEGKVPEME